MFLLEGKPLCPTNFPDGTLSLRVDTFAKLGENKTKLIEWHYESDAEMSILYYLVRHLKDAGWKVCLFMPYIPNARMDRVRNDDEIFTLKYFADFINSLRFESVRVLDPHSNVSCALINNLCVDNGFKYIVSAMSAIGDKDIVMYYPDEGAMKRYSTMFPERPYAFGIKNRDWRTGDIKGITLMNEEVLKGKNILIVDDICSKGGTFYYSAKALKEAGANDIYLYISHCENTIFKGELINSDLIKHIYTTRSIFSLAHEKISVFE